MLTDRDVATSPEKSGRTCIGYLSDPTLDGGIERLRGQLDRIGEILASSSMRLDVLVVDAGVAPTDEGIGPALKGLIERARHRGTGDILVVAGTRCLAYEARSATGALAKLLAAKFVVKDPSGELHPDRVTVELFRDAARREARAPFGPTGLVSLRPASEDEKCDASARPPR